MISIGNDIVDLAAIDKKRTQQKAFYSKILSDKEQQLYSRSSHFPFEIYVWLLWSAKESVYKFAKRLHPELVFSPARIEVSFKPEFSELQNFQNVTLEATGFDSVSTFNLEIVYKSNTYYARSFIYNNLVATFAGNEPKLFAVYWGIKHIENTDYDTQSQTVRAFVIERLAQIYPDNKIGITKSVVGYPVILSNSNQLNVPLSFAHHGHYVSYAFTH
jgi:phosphopantetheine--protein transferase-like protein